MRTPSGDTGGVIVGYFTKIAVVLTLLGVALFDTVSVAVAKINAEDTARQAAVAGSETWLTEHNAVRAFQAAQASAQEHGGTLVQKSFRIDEDGTVHVKMELDATTLVLFRTSRTKKWAHVTTEAAGKAITS